MKGLLSTSHARPLGHVHGKGSGPDEPESALGEWVRIAFIGLILAALIGSFVLIDYGPPAEQIGGPATTTTAPPVPKLDSALLAKVKEDERVHRIQVESAPFLHLLEVARDIVPAVAKALGMPEHMLPLADLKEKSDRYRGQWLWYRGRLDERPRSRVSEPNGSVSTWWEARIRTAEGEPFLFAFSVKPDDKLDKGSWVRAEGFFLKLRDMNTPVELDQAPMLVGAELLADFADWKPVDKLDRETIATVRDGRVINRHLVDDGGDSRRPIDEAQTLPLWHLASFVREEFKKMTPEHVLALPKFITEEQWNDFLHHNTPKGEMVGILGSIQKVRTIEARTNPVGIERWSEAWVQVRELGGRILPIWLPKQLEPFRVGEAVYLAGYFYKVCTYTSVTDEDHAAPLFVAADLLRYKLPEYAMGWYLWVPIVGFMLLLIAFAIWFSRRDQRQGEAMEKAIVNLRRRHRGAVPIADGPGVAR